MLTRNGFRAVLLAAATAVLGRTFALPEAFALAAALLAAPILALGAVNLRPLRVEVQRRIEPEIIHAGDRARIILEVTNRSRWRNPPLRAYMLGQATESTAGRRNEPPSLSPDELEWIPPLRRNAPRMTVTPLDTARRGRHSLGDVRLVRSDPLGLAVRSRTPVGPTTLTILPRVAEVPMPAAGSGVLGDLLVRTAQRLGLGEFDGLRVYIEGDDPRAIHWRASARREELMVRQFSVEGARRCTIVLDCDAHAAATSGGPDADSPFETAVEITATLVAAAATAGLLTRLVISAGPDLQGTDIVSDALDALTVVQPGPPAGPLTRDGSEGLGLLVVVSPAATVSASHARGLVDDPTLVPVRIATGVATPTAVTTAQAEGRGDPTLICAPDLRAFIQGWSALVEGR